MQDAQGGRTDLAKAIPFDQGQFLQQFSNNWQPAGNTAGRKSAWVPKRKNPGIHYTIYYLFSPFQNLVTMMIEILVCFDGSVMHLKHLAKFHITLVDIE